MAKKEAGNRLKKTDSAITKLDIAKINQRDGENVVDEENQQD